MDFRQYLEGKFLEWQQQQGGRRTVSEFAEHIGVTQAAISSWWNNNRIPQSDSIRKLADKLGLEVYDVLGLERPDADLYFIQQNWEYLDTETRHAIRLQAEKYRVENETKRASEKRRTSTP